MTYKDKKNNRLKAKKTKNLQILETKIKKAIQYNQKSKIKTRYQ